MKPICKAIILFVLLLTSATLKSQSFTAHYTYDANGNRRIATVIYLSASRTSASPTVKDELKIDPAANLSISIYPNPTQGDLRVELAGATPEQFNTPSNSIKVWDMQGRLLLSVKTLGATNSVDLSGFSNGTYIMQLFFNGKVKDYKIVKN